MIILRENLNVKGIPQPNRTRLIISDQLPDVANITSAFILAFQGEEILLTRLRSRGLDIPGGHIEDGETPEEAAIRELYEETGAQVKEIELLGYEEIELLGDRPEGYRYPYPNSYMVFYCSAIDKIDIFTGNEETEGGELLEPEEAIKNNWIQVNIGMYEEARRRLKRL